MVAAGKKTGGALAVICVIIITAVVYGRSLGNSFVWDDSFIIVNNNFIKSWKNLPRLFSGSYLSPLVKSGDYLFVEPDAGSGEISYRPVATLSHFADYSLWKLNPFGYHCVSLLLHIANALLLYLLAGLITHNRDTALFAALLFALHPVNVEAVAVVSFREDLLAFFFYLSAFILYIKARIYQAHKKACFYALSLLSFFLALFSKEMALTLPLILILYDYFFLPQGKKKGFWGGLRRYAGYLAVLAFYLWARFSLIVYTERPRIGYPGGSFYANFLTMSGVVAAYIKWIIFPVGIPVIVPGQPYLAARSLSDPWVMPSLLLVMACFAAAIKLYRKSKAASFSGLWFFITLLPVLNIFPLANYMASRFLYLPVAGFCLLAALFLTAPQAPRMQRAMRVLAAVSIVFYAAVTFARSAIWKDDATFLFKMAKAYPDNALVRASLGDYFRKKGALGEAVLEYKTAIRLNPGLADAQSSLGATLGQLGRYEEAIGCFLKAIEINAGSAEAYNNLGVAYARSERWQEAKEAWEKALEINPRYIKAQENLNKSRNCFHFNQESGLIEKLIE